MEISTCVVERGEFRLRRMNGRSLGINSKVLDYLHWVCRIPRGKNGVYDDGAGKKKKKVEYK